MSRRLIEALDSNQIRSDIVVCQADPSTYFLIPVCSSVAGARYILAQLATKRLTIVPSTRIESGKLTVNSTGP